MTVTVAIRFPLGRYHATPWDRSVNEGVAEWPPSPWRLLRALVSTWYTRWPDLPAPALDALLEAIGTPPWYWTPPAKPAHTRHYLPDPDHRSGDTGNTDLTLDPFLFIPTDTELFVQWDADVTDEQRVTLGKLAELVPYLGRADSICDMRLLDDNPTPDGTWWQPDTDPAIPHALSTETVRLLAPTRSISRPTLELTTVQIRKSRRTVPPQTTWITYRRSASPTPPTPMAAEAIRSADLTAVRLHVTGNVPLRSTHGILLADVFHEQVVRALDGGTRDLLGHRGAATNHRHAHWMPVPESLDDAATVESLLIWVPAGLTQDEIAAIIGIRNLTGRRGRNGYQLAGLPDVTLLMRAAGPVQQIAPELCGLARVWRSLTPYLPVRFQKRESLDAYLSADITRELGYREPHNGTTWPNPTVTQLSPGEGLPDRWSIRYRRYRATEQLSAQRRGIGLQIEFDEPITGPVVLGQLSHFGYGIFHPVRE